MRLGALYFWVTLIAIVGASCVTKQDRVAEWPNSQVFMLSQEAGFQLETIELKDGRFRYWFSGDVITENMRRYPIKGTYKTEGGQLKLSSGTSYTFRQMGHVSTLWKPRAVQLWSDHQIIDFYGIFVPVESRHSETPSLKPYFTQQEWDKSAEVGLDLLDKAADKPMRQTTVPLSGLDAGR